MRNKKDIKIKKTEKETINADAFLDDKNKVEALLFAYGKYIDESVISDLCNIDKKKIKKILESLKNDYEQKNSALMIFQEGNSWKINVREKYLSIVRKIVADTELPKSVMETLAVIAWKTPIYQSEVVKIRGNKCYDHIDLLEETGFISKDKKGRSYVIRTTDKFYNYFEIDDGNLKSIFEEVKTPIKQPVEEQSKLTEQMLIPENMEIEKKIEHIELKKLSETEEEIVEKRTFLEKIENKILEIKQKNEILEKEIKIPTIENTNLAETTIEEKIIEEKTDNNDSKQDIDKEQNEEKIENKKSTTENNNTIIEQKKNKSLTKKQLEKKFKEELQRVKQKMNKNDNSKMS
ncbi:MAG: hypothetical protein KatS3mg002_0641 [Candidatus Woesearchaeota archaeon]|nr:MAG: hypothetical protein KatS3mg002_0641 [Candidatus Woesearchaeota archaeon]